MAGSAAEYVRTLLRIQREGHTGILRVRSKGLETRVVFLRGTAVSAKGGTVGDNLGRMLVEEGRITEDEYAQALEAVDDVTLVAQQLLAAGRLTGDEVSGAMARSVRRVIERGLAFRELSMAFHPMDDLPAGTPKFPCAVEPCVLSGTFRHFGSRGAAHYIGGIGDSYLQLRAPVSDVVDRYEMTPLEARFLTNLNGGVQTSRLLRNTPVTDALDANIIVAALVLAAEVTISHQPRASVAPRASDPPPAESVPPGPIHQSSIPPRHMPASFPRANMSQVTMEPVSMPGPPTLPPGGTMPPPGPLTPVQAEKAFQRGVRHVRAQRWAAAAHELEQAADAMPAATEYQLYATWARFRITTDEIDRDALRLELEQLSRELAQEDRGNAMPPYVLGHLAYRDGDTERALKLFKMAAKRDPQNRDAKRHIRLIASRRAGD